ncbi:hypothetical protein [Bradyrhizobium sp. 145]|nr:hypothetical protein [Bradyrhizobium sp. 145]
MEQRKKSERAGYAADEKGLGPKEMRAEAFVQALSSSRIPDAK